MYYVDGHIGKSSETLGNTSSNYIADGKIHSIWNNFHGVRIHQMMSVVTLGGTPGENEQVKYEVVMTSADGACHQCGAMVFYDTQLNANDAAPISTSYGYTGIATIYFAPSLPTIWRAYEGGSPPSFSGLKALGILTGFEAVPPDVFWYGQWGSGVGRSWPDTDWSTIVGGTFGDSATMVKWYPRTSCSATDTVRFCTYYGVGEMPIGTGITLTHTPPTFTAGCDGTISPNPANINAILTNTGTTTATSVVATLGLGGSLLTLDGSGSPNPLPVGTIAGSGGSYMTNWRVNVPPSAFGTTQCYSITVTWSPSGSITRNYCMTIPTPATLFVTAHADDPLICGGCTTLRATATGTATGLSYSWTPTTGLSSPTSAVTTACPTSTTTYTCVVSNAVGCLESATVTVTVGAGTPFVLPHDTICSGSSTTLTAPTTPTGATYQWSTGATTPSITVSPSSTTNYWLEICVTGCCFRDTNTVVVSPPITINPGLSQTICRGSSVTLGGTPAASGGLGTLSYLWTPATGLSNPLIANPLATPASTTTYTLTVTDIAGCYATGTVTITVDDVPSAPVLVYPPNGTTELPPVTIILDWNAVSDPTAVYDLYIDGSLYASGLTVTEHPYTLTCDASHTWHVIARNHCGSSLSSPVWTFSTQVSPSGLNLVSLPDGSTGVLAGSTLFDWSDASGSEPLTYSLLRKWDS